MAVYYFQNENIQIRMVKCEEHILSCLITLTEHNSIDSFFCSIEPHTLDLIDRVIKLLTHPVVSVDIKMIALYSDSESNSKSDMLGKVKSFTIENEVISKTIILVIFFEHFRLRVRGSLKTVYFLHCLIHLNLSIFFLGYCEHLFIFILIKAMLERT